MFNLTTASELSEFLRPRVSGKTVNVHVVKAVSEPKPDFLAMKRAIQGDQLILSEQHENSDERSVAEKV